MNFDDVPNRHKRKVQRIRLPRGRIQTLRPRRPLTPAETIRTNYEIAIRVQSLARPNKLIPPAGLPILRRVPTGDMRIARQRVADEDRIVLVRAECSVSFERHSHRA